MAMPVAMMVSRQAQQFSIGSYYHNGIQRRLTDVHGHVIRDIVA